MYVGGRHDQPAVIYETADPGKFPDDVEQAIGIVPELPPGMKKQAQRDERIYRIESASERTVQGLKLCDKQVAEAKAIIVEIFQGRG